MSRLTARVLIIDDSLEIQGDFEKVLVGQSDNTELSNLENELFGESDSTTPVKLFDCDVACASQGLEGVELFRESLLTNPFDIVFVDMRMPPGWEGLRTIKEIWSACPDQFIVLCTAYSDYTHDQIMAELGGHPRFFIIKKPFQAEEVLQAVSSAVFQDTPNIRTEKAQARDLKTAILQKELQVMFQPILRLDDDSIYGFEALCRWSRKGEGSVSPADFVRVAESYGVIDELGLWIAGESIRAENRINTGSSEKQMVVTINVSALQLLPSLAEELVALCTSVGSSPNQIGVELTETAIMEDSDRINFVLAELMSAGFTVLIDDFGSGQSTLHRLATLPFHILKLDREFCANLSTNHRGQSILRSVKSMTSDLGRMLLAEGIETADDMEMLKELKCDLVQGYFVAKPLGMDDALAFVTSTAVAKKRSA